MKCMKQECEVCLVTTDPEYYLKKVKDSISHYIFDPNNRWRDLE